MTEPRAGGLKRGCHLLNTDGVWHPTGGAAPGTH